MTIEYEIEYIKLPNGEYKFENITDYDYHFNDYNVLNVEFEAYPSWENDGIGSYEWWGAPGYDYGNDFVSLSRYGSPIWDKTKYSDEQNKVITSFMDTMECLNALEDLFCKEYEKLHPKIYHN